MPQIWSVPALVFANDAQAFYQYIFQLLILQSLSNPLPPASCPLPTPITIANSPFSTATFLTTMMSGSLSIGFSAHKWAYIFCAVASIGALCYGYDNTYYTGVLGMRPFIDVYGDHLDSEGKKALGVTFTSLTASSIYIGDLLGALLSELINKRFGRKGVFWCASVCILAGGIAQIADNGIMGVIVLGRIFIGLGVGQFTVTSLLYIGEIAPVQVRGPALMMFQLLQSIAQLVASSITQGTEAVPSSVSYRVPMGGLVVLPLIMFATLRLIPESPVWYIHQGRREQARTALLSVNRGRNGYDPEPDLLLHEKAVQEQRAATESSSWLSMVTNPIERRKTLYSCGAMFAQQINGILFFYVYGVVFAQAIGIKQPFLISLITNILQIFAVAAAIAFATRIRRRTNLLVTTSMMLIAFIIIGSIGTRPLNTAGQYIIVIFSYIIIVTFNFGHGPLAYTIAREMAVGPNQDKIMSAAIMTFFFTIWAVSFTAPYIYYTAKLGPMLCFVYAGTTVISLLYVWFCVGETQGRTNLDIESFFQDKIPVQAWRTYQVNTTHNPDGQLDVEKNLKHGTDVVEVE